MTLGPAFRDRAFAHRGLHGADRPENTWSAFVAAVAARYGIELDVQLSADGVAMVFHDTTLDRMTGQSGRVAERSASDLAALRIGGSRDGIEPLADILRKVDGSAPVLIELKPQDAVSALRSRSIASATAGALSGYKGAVAVMSFDPDIVAEIAHHAPHLPRGLTTCDFSDPEWEALSAITRRDRAQITEYDRVGAVFLSHDHLDLTNPAVTTRKAQGAYLFTWTIRSPQEEAQARRIADNITFEGYLAP